MNGLASKRRRASAGAWLALLGSAVLLFKFPWQSLMWLSGGPPGLAIHFIMWLALPFLAVALAVGLLLGREWARLLLCLLAILCVWGFGRQVWAIAYWRIVSSQETVQGASWLFGPAFAWMVVGLVISAGVLFLASTGRVREALSTPDLR